MDAPFSTNITKELAILQEIAEQLKPFLSIEGQQIVEECLKQFESQELVLMVAGEVSVGKSSLLNALLGKPILLTDLTETTAALTFIRSVDSDNSAKANQAKVTYYNGNVEWLDLNPEALKKVTTSLENDDALNKVEKVEVYVDGSVIPKGVTIIDTPGLNGGERHSDLTHREMGLCHIALFLLDASKAGMASEKRELNRLYDYAPQVFFILNKWDQVKKLYPNMTLRVIKGKYLDAIGRIIEKNEQSYTISSRNIYVISAKEGLTAELEYFNKKENQQPEASPTIFDDLTDMLPDRGKQNEIFHLFQDMSLHLSQSSRRSMLYQRPLLTMKNLAQEALDKVDIELKAMKDTSDIDVKIRQVEKELLQQKEQLENRLLGIAEQIKVLAEIEQQDILSAGENAREEVVSTLETKIRHSVAFRNHDLASMQTKEFTDSIKAQLLELLVQYIQKPVQKQIDTFMTLVNQNLESAQPDGLSLQLSKIKAPRASFSAIEKEQKQKLEELSELQLGMTDGEKQLEKLQTQISKVEDQIKKYRIAKQRVEELNRKIDEAEKKIKRLGSRPGAD